MSDPMTAVLLRELVALAEAVDNAQMPHSVSTTSAWRAIEAARNTTGGVLWLLEIAPDSPGTSGLIATVKAIRYTSVFDLRQAVDLAKSAPCALGRVRPETADALLAAGAKVEWR